MTQQIDRILNAEYLQARSAAWDAGAFAVGHPMDPVLTDFRGKEDVDALLWQAFMAGSDWERKYRGARYDEGNSAAPWVDLNA